MAPFASDKQRRFIYAKAGEGKKWAEKFVKDAHDDAHRSIKAMHKKERKK